MRRVAPGAIVLWLVVGLFAGAGVFAEVSVERGSGRRIGFSMAGGTGGGGADPWPTVIYRLHIDPSQALNPGGDEEGDVAPQFAIDPVDGAVHVVWADADGPGTDHEIALSSWNDSAWTPAERLTDDGGEDLDPSIAFAPGGTCRITWWRPTVAGGEVVYTERSPQQTWSTPERVNDASESAAHPSVADRGGKAWIAYQVDQASSRRIVAAHRVSGTWADDVIAETSYAGPSADGDVDVEIHTRGGALWVDWVDGDGVLGYSVWDETTATWSAVRTVAYDSAPGEAEPYARARARTTVRLRVLAGD